MPPATPPLGASVYFMSGRLLGQVAEVAADAFLVITEEQKHWLRQDAVFTVENTRVTLICEPNGLANYTLEREP